MKNLKYISLLFLTFVMLTSCDNEASIQQFYVDSESNNDYLMIDIPANIVNLPESATAESKQAYNSIDKINLLAFKINETNKANYEIEKTKVTAILKNPNYIEMMRINMHGSKIKVKYIGTEDSIEELILFASNKDAGFALARVLGNDMRPENMIKLLNNLKDIDKDSDVFEKLERFFKK
ncbi:MAG TPA: DUF4252 domain-containing protein [Flavobacteriaceae bacterium]|nr:DUF4252 domain-containing protein [Flavobacteriaceae bacterium]